MIKIATMAAMVYTAVGAHPYRPRLLRPATLPARDTESGHLEVDFSLQAPSLSATRCLCEDTPTVQRRRGLTQLRASSRRSCRVDAVAVVSSTAFVRLDNATAVRPLSAGASAFCLWPLAVQPFAFAPAPAPAPSAFPLLRASRSPPHQSVVVPSVA